jgi:hypothetical protein
MMWLGDLRKASKIVLFFRGGGFIRPIGSGHLELCFNAYVQPSSDVEVPVAILQYWHCPAAVCPGQLPQVAEGLCHIFQSGFDPGNIGTSGNSAGGNLTVQLLSNLIRPQLESRPVHISQLVAGAFAMSLGRAVRRIPVHIWTLETSISLKMFSICCLLNGLYFGIAITPRKTKGRIGLSFFQGDGRR